MSPNELSELVPLAETLNKESNDLNETIAALNERIASLNLGISAWTALMTEDEDPDSEYQIGFTKFDADAGNRWQLAYRERRRLLDKSGDEFIEDDDNPHFFHPVPLLQTSRNIRIEGLRCVPELLRQMKIEAQEKIRAMVAGKKIVAELGGECKQQTENMNDLVRTASENLRHLNEASGSRRGAK